MFVRYVFVFDFENLVGVEDFVVRVVDVNIFVIKVFDYNVREVGESFSKCDIEVGWEIVIDMGEDVMGFFDKVED